MESLKEWATVIKALESGKQTVLLRKGGILEIASGFKIESNKFLLYPTWEHQEFHHIKPEFHNFLEDVKSNHPEEGFNIVTSFAEVLDEADITSEKTIEKLSSFHIWSDSYIKERRNWKPEKLMKAVLLRVYKIPEIKISLKPEYQGCKSWININEEILEGQSVLNSEDIQSSMEKFKEITK